MSTEKLLGNGDGSRPPPGFIVGDDGPFIPSQVKAEEQACMRDLNAQRIPDAQRDAPFSLAFSGGGIRAAAFQSGVLWRLAKMNRLKDVEYFAAVSGGGYITSAFASHCFAADPPEPGRAKEWYLEVVAKTLCRMQENAGDFVRDSVKDPWGSRDASFLPRIFDLPVLLLTLFVAMSWNPLMLVVGLLMPLTNLIELFYGAAMRAAFCAPEDVGWFTVFQEYSPIMKLVQLVELCVLGAFLVWVLRRVVPAFKLTQAKNGKWTASRWFLFGHSAAALLTRFTVGALFMTVLITLIPASQIGFFSFTEEGETLRRNYCYLYVQADHDEGCSNVHKDSPWFADPSFVGVADIKGTSTEAVVSETQKLEEKEGQLRLVTLFGWVLLASLIAAVCCMPIMGAELLTFILCVVGPLFVAVLLLCFVRFRVYGPIAPERLGGQIHFDQESWDKASTWMFRVAFVVLPFYEEVRAILHFYYRRSLQMNFFKGGKDVCIVDLAKSPYCPFILLTGTSSDFQPPNDVDNISELSFSALHLGSLETGYVAMQPYFSLSKCTALTGAGCLDAISLSMSNALTMRFWLQVLNLSWGDYIMFQGKTNPVIEAVTRFVRGCFGPNAQAYTMRFLHRLPSVLLWWSCMGLMTLAWEYTQAGDAPCDRAKSMFSCAIMLVLLFLALSFFHFLPYLDLFGLSPVIRQLHQATQHCAIGDVDSGIAPPRMLYVTDGGVKDCTTLVQLMQRRCARILLVLAAADANDDLGVLKAAMQVASQHKLGSFFDPKDPRKDINVLMDRFKHDRSMPYMHVGIVYGWDGDEECQRGDLFVVKNRLPPDHEGEPVQPPMTEEEICTGCGPKARDDADAWGGMTTDSLGPFGCCDCCHTAGLNCGPKFPHGTFTGYLYLSPQWCTSLSRLGFDLSQEAIDSMMSLS